MPWSTGPCSVELGFWKEKPCGVGEPRSMRSLEMYQVFWFPPDNKLHHVTPKKQATTRKCNKSLPSSGEQKGAGVYQARPSLMLVVLLHLLTPPCSVKSGPGPRRPCELSSPTLHRPRSKSDAAPISDPSRCSFCSTLPSRWQASTWLPLSCSVFPLFLSPTITKRSENMKHKSCIVFH